MKKLFVLIIVAIIGLVVWGVVQQCQIGALNRVSCRLVTEIEHQKLEIRFLNDMDAAIYERLPSSEPTGLVEQSHE